MASELLFELALQGGGEGLARRAGGASNGGVRVSAGRARAGFAHDGCEQLEGGDVAVDGIAALVGGVTRVRIDGGRGDAGVVSVCS